MAQYIQKDILREKIDQLEAIGCISEEKDGYDYAICDVLKIIDTLETKEVDLIIHTIIAECCDWLAMCTELSHDEIEELRNLMLTIKDEQLKAQKGE